ncbi:hypothetical protein [Aquimarina sediminis]|nr:hypothetical protein [Aquimarina sediminis]
MGFIKDITKEISPVTTTTILWLPFIAVVLGSFFFTLGYQYQAV